MKKSWHIAQEPDRVATARLLLISALALVVALAGVLAAAQMLHHSSASASPEARPSAAAGRPSPLEQGLLERVERGIQLQTEQKKRLAAYGWVDRRAGIANIPIERAMELRVQEQP
jgi:hypothetical protein